MIRSLPRSKVSLDHSYILQLDLVIPANNRGRKALATIYWLLASEILQDSKAMKYEIDDFETKTAEVEEEL